eukprot:m.151087 g.151087  ORF g.151087 m.151087 type:complete len:116 (-) comp17399_c1_seq5:198-545(-)
MLWVQWAASWVQLYACGLRACVLTSNLVCVESTCPCTQRCTQHCTAPTADTDCRRLTQRQAGGGVRRVQRLALCACAFGPLLWDYRNRVRLPAASPRELLVEWCQQPQPPTDSDG